MYILFAKTCNTHHEVYQHLTSGITIRSENDIIGSKGQKICLKLLRYMYTTSCIVYGMYMHGYLVRHLEIMPAHYLHFNSTCTFKGLCTCYIRVI